MHIAGGMVASLLMFGNVRKLNGGLVVLVAFCSGSTFFHFHNVRPREPNRLDVQKYVGFIGIYRAYFYQWLRVVVL